MKKLFSSIFLFFLVISANADSAKISSQSLVKANVAQDMAASVVAQEVDGLRRFGYDVRAVPYDRNPNSWFNYVASFSIDNRIWYISDIGAIYCTLLISLNAPIRKYAVYTYITKGNYYRGSSELVDIDYLVEVYELIGWGTPNYSW